MYSLRHMLARSLCDALIALAVGLQFHDIGRLLKAFNALIERGHTIVVIEHHPDVIKCADYVIDLGPEGGREGGNIVACGTPEEVAASGKGYTSKFLRSSLAAE